MSRAIVAPPLALVIDHDFGFLGRAVELLGRSGFQVHARLSPSGLREFTSALRPDVILLGLPFWEQGWAPVLRRQSPESIVFPVAADADDLNRLSLLLRPASPGEAVHAA